MLEADKQAFEALLHETWAAYGKQPPSIETVRAWWRHLSKYDMETVQRGLDHMIQHKEHISLAGVFESVRESEKWRRIRASWK
jgi:hypothetical protein